MRLKLIACKVLTREVGLLSASCENFIDITWLRQGYHNEPDKLRGILQEQIDRIDAGEDPCSCGGDCGDFDAILIGYGLCSNGVAGISSKKYPLVIPRAHDCITLFLGSKERYSEVFARLSGGIYWYTPGWIENSIMPSKERKEKALEIYTELYGEDNAEYLVDMESGWLRDYKAACFVKNNEIENGAYKEYTKDCAEYLGWEYREEEGDLSLLKRFLNGQWDEKDFLIVPPGSSAQPSYDDRIITLGENPA